MSERVTDVLMLAAEHGGLPGGKVGGVGDVIEQLPPALVAAGLTVNLLVPAYGVYHELPGSRFSASCDIDFAGSMQRVELYKLPALEEFAGATCWVIHHPVFAQPAGQIYHHDGADSPFATDANIYALFCAAAVELLSCGALAMPDVVHLHDWHAATFALLCRSYAGSKDGIKERLAKLRIVYTVHNLALQGIRPFTGHPSSLSAWFPDLKPPVDRVADPRYTNCYNPMRAGIVLADKVHVVSPGYAQEVLLPNAPEFWRHGGEGLEQDLARKAADGNLFGILNGCEYPEGRLERIPDKDRLARRRDLLGSMQQQLAAWFGQHTLLRTSDYLADKALDQVGEQLSGDPDHCLLLTSVGRVTPQKVGLLLRPFDADADADATLLDQLLQQLGDRGLLVLLGSGDEALETQLVAHAARHANFVFLCGYSDTLAEQLYRSGDLFLMPSLFEPCGISQLLAMREGQPCLVHAVGGLRDTVTADTGFVFEGDTLAQKSKGAAEALRIALAEFATAGEENSAWNQRCQRAAAARFSWGQAARRYVQELYQWQDEQN